MKRIGIFVGHLVGLCVVLTQSGCNVQQEPAVLETITAASFFQGSPNSADLDVFVNGGQLNATVFTYKSFSNYLQFQPGQKSVSFSINGTGTKLIDTTFTLTGTKAYTIFVANKYTSPSSTAIGSFIVSDSDNPLSTISNSMIRFVHLAPDTQPVSVKMTSGPTVVDLTASKEYKGYTSFVEITPITYSIEINRVSDGALLFTIPFTPKQGVFHSLLLIGLVNPPNGNTNTLSYKMLN